MRRTLASFAAVTDTRLPSSRTALRAAFTLLLVLSPAPASRAVEPQGCGNAPFAIDAHYPGGNIILERIDGDTAFIKPDLRDTQGWWFYWNFRVSGAAGRTITFKFTDGNPIGVRGPALSTDAGKTWAWLGTATVKDASFKYTVAKDAREVRFCLAMPYQQSNLDDFLTKHTHPNLKVTQLCKTRKGRPVERIHAGKIDGEPRYRVLVTARHHACEMMASYSLEGLLEAVLADDPEGLWLRNNVEILAVPFMDKDGVEDGDQGKNRRPHDHNRDYIGDSIYPSVAALRAFVPKWSDGKPLVTLDLHCPYIRGQYNEVIYIVGNSDPDIYAQQFRFGKILENVASGPLPYDNDDILPFGKAWNTKANYGSGKSCSRWAAELDDVKLATSFEIPYANVGSRTVTAETARAFGRDLAAALFTYLTQLEAPKAATVRSNLAPIRKGSADSGSFQSNY